MAAKKSLNWITRPIPAQVNNDAETLVSKFYFNSMRRRFGFFGDAGERANRARRDVGNEYEFTWREWNIDAGRAARIHGCDGDLQR